MAQENQSDNAYQNFTYEKFIVNDTINRYQIGINTHFALDGILNDSVRTPIEILLRRQFSPYGALRLRLLGISRNYRREAVEISSLIKTHRSTLGLALGYEWQNLISKRWKWYYGAEMQGQLSWDNSIEESVYFDQRTNESVDRRDVINRRTERFSLLPFAGVRFHITPYLFVSTELKIDVFYEKFNFRRDDYWTRLDGSVSKPFSEFSIENRNVNFQPYSGIFLNLIL